MVWNIKYLVYNNVKWPRPELWCHGGFSVCFVVYGFEILIFCCRLIRLSGLGEWIMVGARAAFWSIEHIHMLTSSCPIRGRIWDELSVHILMCQSSQRYWHSLSGPQWALLVCSYSSAAADSRCAFFYSFLVLKTNLHVCCPSSFGNSQNLTNKQKHLIEEYQNNICSKSPGSWNG